MDDYIASPKNATMQFLDYVLGNDGTVSRDLRLKLAETQQANAEKKRNSTHVTQGKHEDKEALMQSLREDPVLGPILSEVEVLVKEALGHSKDHVL